MKRWSASPNRMSARRLTAAVRNPRLRGKAVTRQDGETEIDNVIAITLAESRRTPGAAEPELPRAAGRQGNARASAVTGGVRLAFVRQYDLFGCFQKRPAEQGGRGVHRKYQQLPPGVESVDVLTLLNKGADHE